MPSADQDHYQPFSAMYGTETNASYRPSLASPKPKTMKSHFLRQLKVLVQWVRLYVVRSVTFPEKSMQLVSFPVWRKFN